MYNGYRRIGFGPNRLAKILMNCISSLPSYGSNEGLSALDPDSIHIDLTPQSSLRTNWIATGSIHFDPVRTTNLTRDDSYTRPNYRHMIAYLPLAVTQSCFWICHPADFGHCLLFIHTTTRLFLVQSDNRSRSSTNTCFN